MEDPMPESENALYQALIERYYPAGKRTGNWGDLIDPESIHDFVYEGDDEDPEQVVFVDWLDVPEGAVVRSMNAPKLRLWKRSDLRTDTRLDSESYWYLEDCTTLEINRRYSPFTLEELHD